MKKLFSLLAIAMMCTAKVVAQPVVYTPEPVVYVPEPVPPVAPVAGTTYGTGAAIGVGAVIVGSVAAALIATSGGSGNTSH